MNITDFKIRAHNICDRWYFRQTDKLFEVWERPIKRGPGFMTDYKVMVIPLEILCQASMSDDNLAVRLQKLKWMNAMRQQNAQEKVLDDCTRKNDEAKAAREKRFMDETGAFARQERKNFKRLAEELGVSRLGAINRVMKKDPRLCFDDAKKVLTKLQGDYR